MNNDYDGSGVVRGKPLRFPAPDSEDEKVKSERREAQLLASIRKTLPRRCAGHKIHKNGCQRFVRGRFDYCPECANTLSWQNYWKWRELEYKYEQARLAGPSNDTAEKGALVMEQLFGRRML